jgi:glycosyltransferase involved in cell wall biosynthesis
MRYLYVKDGDAVNEVRRACSAVNEGISGTGFYAADFIRALPDEDLYIVCRWKLADSFQSANVWVESLLPPNGGTMSRLMARGRSAFELASRIWRWRPERIVCGRSGELLWTTAFMAKVLGIPLVHARHNEIQRRAGVGSVSSMLDRASIRSCHAVVCHGQFLVDEVKSIGVNQSRIKEFKLPVKDFPLFAERTSAPLKLTDFCALYPKVLMFAGRVERDKGIFDLLDAYSEIVKNGNSNLGLAIVGDGNNLGELQRKAQSLKLDARILYLGRLSHEQLAAAMAMATAVVTPTRREFPEGRCMVVVEALILGVPVIASNFGPFPYAVTHGVNGLLFEPNNAHELQQSLERLVGEAGLLEKLRNGANRSAEGLRSESSPSFSEALKAAFDLPI